MLDRAGARVLLHDQYRKRHDHRIRRGRRGQLRLLAADGVSARTDGGPIDIAATPGGRFLYELNGTGGTLGIYKVASDGSLTKTGSVTGLRAFDDINGMQGLVVA